MTAAPEAVVRAAGGLVVRGGEVLLVHRPKYDDWTFPKGKAGADESYEDCAIREVREETGLRCALGRELEPSDYRDPLGRPKHVRWWVMEPLEDDGFTPGKEIDEVRWLAPPEAAELLSYPRDAALLDEIWG